MAGDEQERHSGVAGHRLGHVGLAGARLALEQDAAARVAAEPVLEGRIAEEEVQRLDDLVAQRGETLDVVEADVDLLWPVQQVRRASLAEHGQQHGHADHHDHQHHRQPEHRVRAEAEAAERVQRAAGQPPPPGKPADDREHHRQPREPSLAAALARLADVEVGRAQHRDAAEHAARALHARSPPGSPLGGAVRPLLAVSHGRDGLRYGSRATSGILPTPPRRGTRQGYRARSRPNGPTGPA